MPSQVTPDDGTHVTVRLFKREASGGLPSIATVTFCEGDADTAFSALKRKARQAMDANPWIAGRLVKKTLVHPRTGSDDLVDEMITMERSAKIARNTPYPDLVTAVGDPKITVQDGKNLKKSGGLVTKLTVVPPEAAGGEFAIVFSISHVIADGHDYYKIFDMIAGKAPFEPLTAERVHAYEDREPEWTGKKDFSWLSGGGLIKGMLGGMLFGPKAHWCCYRVDQAKVESLKAAAVADASGDVSFVSTNDIITSHFFGAAGARVGMMVVNFRDKIPLKISGCYEGCLLLDPENYSKPSKVRKCVAVGPPFTRQTGARPLPGIFNSCPMAFVTSWASFPFEVCAEGAEPVLHLPCMAMPDMMDVGIIFRPRKGELGILCFAKRAKPGALVGGAGSPLGDTVDEGIFPHGK